MVYSALGGSKAVTVSIRDPYERFRRSAKEEPGYYAYAGHGKRSIQPLPFEVADYSVSFKSSGLIILDNGD